MRKFILMWACYIAFLTGAAVGETIPAKNSCKTEVKVAAATSYVAGCTMAFHAVNHDRGDDPLDAIYNEFCVHNATVFAKEMESNQTK